MFILVQSMILLSFVLCVAVVQQSIEMWSLVYSLFSLLNAGDRKYAKCCKVLEAAN